MNTVKHISTGAIFTITKIAPNTIYMVCTNPGTNKILRIGSKEKTNHARIQAAFIVID